MLDANLTQQLQTYLGNLREPIELVASLGDDAKSDQTRELLNEIAMAEPKAVAPDIGNTPCTPPNSAGRSLMLVRPRRRRNGWPKVSMKNITAVAAMTPMWSVASR